MFKIILKKSKRKPLYCMNLKPPSKLWMLDISVSKLTKRVTNQNISRTFELLSFWFGIVVDTSKIHNSTRLFYILKLRSALAEN
jgi:hypothetical protein